MSWLTAIYNFFFSYVESFYARQYEKRPWCTFPFWTNCVIIALLMIMMFSKAQIIIIIIWWAFQLIGRCVYSKIMFKLGVEQLICICLVFVEFDGRDDAGIVEHVRRVAQRGQRPQVAVASELGQAVRKFVQTGKGRIFFIFRIRV